MLRLLIEKLESILDLGRLQNPSTGRELIRLIIIDYITLVRDFAFSDRISGKMPEIHRYPKGILDLRRKFFTQKYLTFGGICGTVTVQEKTHEFVSAFSSTIEPKFFQFFRHRYPICIPAAVMVIFLNSGFKLLSGKTHLFCFLRSFQTAFPEECRLSV